MIDHAGKTWLRADTLCTCDDGLAMSIVPEMTDAYLLSVIASFDAPSIPEAVTMRQARLALHAAGLLDAVTAAITAAGPTAVIEWDYAQEVHRGYGLVAQMAGALGMTDAQIDQLFLTAAGL